MSGCEIERQTLLELVGGVRRREKLFSASRDLMLMLAEKEEVNGRFNDQRLTKCTSELCTSPEVRTGKGSD